jgi:magnesium transporter
MRRSLHRLDEPMQMAHHPPDLHGNIRRYTRPCHATLRPDQSIEEALASLREQEVAERVIYLYVTDQDGKLVGVLPTRRLLMSPPNARVGDVMVRGVVAMPESATLLDAAEYFLHHRFLALPIVDENERMLGIVDISAFTEGILPTTERERSVDAFQVIGVHVALGRRATAWMSFKDRFPWLLCNIAGGILAALFAALYEDVLEQVVMLALFMPVVLALGESVSIQSLTITLMGLHGARVRWSLIGRAIRREIGTALLLGLGSGVLVGVVAMLWRGMAPAAITIGASIGISVIAACLIGVLVPTIIRAMRRDPKIAAGPIVLATTDIATLVFYFTIARLLLV